MSKKNKIGNYFVLEYCICDAFETFLWHKIDKKFKNTGFPTIDNLFSKKEDAEDVLKSLPVSMRGESLVKPYDFPMELL